MFKAGFRPVIGPSSTLFADPCPGVRSGADVRSPFPKPPRFRISWSPRRATPRRSPRSAFGHGDHRRQIEARQRRRSAKRSTQCPASTSCRAAAPEAPLRSSCAARIRTKMKVLIDGVDVSAQQPHGRLRLRPVADRGHRTHRGAARAASGLYGSDAIGGVISITTKKGSGPPKVTASVEGGSYAR